MGCISLEFPFVTPWFYSYLRVGLLPVSLGAELGPCPIGTETSWREGGVGRSHCTPLPISLCFSHPPVLPDVWASLRGWEGASELAIGCIGPCSPFAAGVRRDLDPLPPHNCAHPPLCSQRLRRRMPVARSSKAQSSKQPRASKAPSVTENVPQEKVWLWAMGSLGSL